MSLNLQNRKFPNLRAEVHEKGEYYSPFYDYVIVFCSLKPGMIRKYSLGEVNCSTKERVLAHWKQFCENNGYTPEDRG